MEKHRDVIVVGSGPVGRTIARRLAEQDDRVRMRAMEADVQRLAAILGRWRRGCEATWLPHGSAHLAGPCRMDRPGWKGVTNSTGKVHGFENLYLINQRPPAGPFEWPSSDPQLC